MHLSKMLQLFYYQDIFMMRGKLIVIDNNIVNPVITINVQNKFYEKCLKIGLDCLIWYNIYI